MTTPEVAMLRDALEHISRTAAASRSSSRRTRWIQRRADGALRGETFDPKAYEMPKRDPDAPERLKRQLAHAKRLLAAHGIAWEEDPREVQAQDPATPGLPVRAFRLTLRMDADSQDELGSALFNLSVRADRGELTKGVSGGPSSGYIYELLQDPAQTHDAYHAQVRAYLDAKKGAPAHG